MVRGPALTGRITSTTSSWDYKDNVWISGSSSTSLPAGPRSDDMILKFTNDGKFIKQLRRAHTTSHGSKDPMSVNKPGDLYVSPKTNELYVADGYGNRRLIVYDGDTLAFKRHVGSVREAARGRRDLQAVPVRREARPSGVVQGAEAAGPRILDTEGPGADRFASPVHGVLVSNDDIVYVVDRSNRRVQLFTPADGKYLKEMFVNRRPAPAAGSVSGLAFSPDKAAAIPVPARIMAIRTSWWSTAQDSRNPLSIRKEKRSTRRFPGRASYCGRLQGQPVHGRSSAGAFPRAQRFNFNGMSSTVPPYALTAADLAPKPSKP